MNPKISVLMGVYNCADTLEEAIRSIINQSYSNWELIICDDGSQDNTYQTALEIAKNDSRITVIQNETNLSLAPTLNKCLDLASGDYIARMDGDDTCSPDRFQKELSYLEENTDFALVSSWMNLYDSEGVFRVVKFKDFPTEKDLVKGPPFCHAGCMMKTSVLRDLNGYNTSTEVERIEDYDLWYRFYVKGYKGAGLQEALYNMRDDRKAISRRKMKYRINSYRLRKRIIKTFHLPKYNYFIALKPIIIGMIPTFLYKVLHRR